MKNNYPRFQNNSQLRSKQTTLAREFRKDPTKSEVILWQVLRGKKLDGIKFRRQQPIGPFVVDLYNEKDLSSVLEIIRVRIRELQSEESPSPILGEGTGGG